MRVKIFEHNSVFYATILKDDKAVNGKRMQSKDLSILNKKIDLYLRTPVNKRCLFNHYAHDLDYDILSYYCEVWIITEENKNNVVGIEKRGTKNYQIDHIIPIIYGFYNNIDPCIIGGFENLQIITSIENLKKNTKITPEAEKLLLKHGLL